LFVPLEWLAFPASYSDSERNRSSQAANGRRWSYEISGHRGIHRVGGKALSVAKNYRCLGRVRFGIVNFDQFHSSLVPPIAKKRIGKAYRQSVKMSGEIGRRRPIAIAFADSAAKGAARLLSFPR
jgi:hypothetical protein